MSRHVAPVSPRLEDANIERVVRGHFDAIRALQAMPSAELSVVPNVTLVDSVATPISHGLGRAPIWVAPSCPRGPASSGRIEEIRDGSVDRTKQVLIKATGWGATIILDLVVL